MGRSPTTTPTNKKSSTNKNKKNLLTDASGFKAVAGAANGEEEDGLDGVGFKVAAEADNKVIDAAGVELLADFPDVAQEFFAADDASGVLGEVFEEVDFEVV